MDQLMRQNGAWDRNDLVPIKRELTCSVHFTNPKFGTDSSSSEDELGSVTRLVSKIEDLDLEHVFKTPAKPGDLVKGTNRSLFDCGHNFEEVRDWLGCKQLPKDRLKTVLRYMVENHLKTTVQIDINKMYFNCHLVVLQVYSQFFMELQQMPLVVTLPEDKVSQKAFMLIYKWMLSDEPSLERKHILAVYVAATYLRIDALLFQCWRNFDDVKCFNEDTACILYVETQSNPALDIVRNLMLTRIQKFFLIFVATRDFLDVPLKHLLYLLSSSAICVNTEIEILFIAVRWLSHDWSARRRHGLKLMNCVRFHLMPLWYLLCVRREETHKLIVEMLNWPDVDKTINMAIAHITSSIYDERQNDAAGDLGRILKGDDRRRWIHDKACLYHHLMGCPNTREIRYKHFELYLMSLQQQPLDHWAKIEFLDLDDGRKCCVADKMSLKESFQSRAQNL